MCDELLTDDEQKYYNALRSRGYLALGAEIKQLRARLAEAENVIDKYADKDLWGQDDDDSFCIFNTDNLNGYVLAEAYRAKYPKEGK